MRELSPEEKLVLSHLVGAWNAFVALPIQHGDDISEFRHGIHRLQEKVMARPARKMDGEGRFA
ncbi:hypothetical protein J2045_003424 [Peteryoungia aggregata LMG 23059]|uniref:Uncharacterized protein n=1 Tax=Peteryoungia aggregata LMG 23059 TaxID=1368425 RepID=A0ABU0GCA8_9HYPH|nr:hypothetical protein [Peteryoungia aggregata LMG 23059]